MKFLLDRAFHWLFPTQVFLSVEVARSFALEYPRCARKNVAPARGRARVVRARTATCRREPRRAAA